MHKNTVLKSLSIVTFNTAGVPFIETEIRRRYHLIASELNKQKYDVINLQEVHVYITLNILKRLLTSFPYVSFEPSLIGPKGGLVSFSKYPIDKKIYYKFPKLKLQTLTEMVQVVRAGNRGVLVQQIGGWYILNTHLAANLLHQWNMQTIYYQMQIGQIGLLQTIIKNIPKSKPLILTGDFNIAKDTNEYDNLIKLLSLQDIFNHESYATYNHKFIRSENKFKIHIDQMFITENSVKILRKGILFEKPFRFPKSQKMKYLSDHIALFATLEYIRPV